MITVRRAADRGHFNHGWLDTNHTFSFGNYWDPQYQGFSDLLVINEDRVQPGKGFGTHPHSNMEIISYVLEGALEHRDSLGTGSVIRPGEVQRMSAGTGVTHSEFNHSSSDPVHFLQIWIVPERTGIKPGYEQQTIAEDEKRGRLRPIAARDGVDGAVTIHQDARVYAAVLEPGQSVTYDLRDGRHGWVQVVRGAVDLNGTTLGQSDGAAIAEERSLTITANEPAEVLLFDLR